MTHLSHKIVNSISTNATLLKKIMDVSIRGLMIVDDLGMIVYANKSFEEIHNVKLEDVIGKHVTQVIENTRLHIVAQTGTTEKDELQKIQGHEYVVSRFPIVEENKCIGAVGFIRFQYTNEVKNLLSRIEKLEKVIHKVKKDKANLENTRFTFDNIIAQSPKSSNWKNMAMRTATSNSTVLLLGESGVGKEVFAHSIHNLSKRNKEPFIRLNCSAIQENLFESELFGYEEGAFTGAKKGGKKGKFELANNGTIFLDEIGDMPLSTQAKLLRVIQEKEIDKLGGEDQIKIDVRIIAATNQDLSKLVEEGKFRRDLYYRLNVIPIFIPPLRERNEDIPEMLRIFWKELKRHHGIYHKYLSDTALITLQNYDWPGNIRELRNVLERAMLVVMQDEITSEHIKTILLGYKEETPEVCLTAECKLDDLIESTTKRAISLALAKSNNNRSQAAKILGISRGLLYKKMHMYKMISD